MTRAKRTLLALFAAATLVLGGATAALANGPSGSGGQSACNSHCQGS